jgi:two-component system response regulator YesN
MKRILIVDDEYLVRFGLKTIIDWGEYGYTIAGEASNGKEALELFRRTGADVVLTDIKMPVMDGLELTRAIRETGKKVKIIILSHYDDFSYAREAINLGAFRYILKTELTRANILNMLKSLFHSESENAAEAAAADDIAVRREQYIGQYLLPFFSGAKNAEQCPPYPEEADSVHGVYVMLCASCRLTNLLLDMRTMFPKAVKVLFTDAFGTADVFAACRGETFDFIALLPLAGDGTEREAKIADLARRIVKNVRQYYNVNLFIGISGAGPANSMARLFTEARSAVDMCFFSEKDFVCVHGRYSPCTAGPPPRISHGRLSAAVEAGQKQEMLEYIQNIFRELRTLKNYTFMYNTFIDFLSIAKAICEHYQFNNQTSLGENKFKYDAFYELPFIGDVEMYIYSLFLDLLAGRQNGAVAYSYIVKKTLAFIRQNHVRNISLSDAAENAEVSHSYLSFIFKQETGTNFNAYLTRFRIEEAKKLLRNTNLRIYEVAEKTGFSNQYYFSKVFKEHTGMGCKEYRDAAPPQL